MRAQLVGEEEERTFILVFDPGDEVIQSFTRFAETERLSCSRFTGIGGFREATVGFFDLDRKDYLRIPLREQVEVLSLAGDVTLDRGRPKVHAHVVVGTRDGTARGGHLLEGTVRPTLEVVVVESPAHLERETDPATGLALIRLDPRRSTARQRAGRKGDPS